jgi:hypothetical protein
MQRGKCKNAAKMQKSSEEAKTTKSKSSNKKAINLNYLFLKKL